MRVCYDDQIDKTRTIRTEGKLLANVTWEIDPHYYSMLLWVSVVAD